MLKKLIHIIWLLFVAVLFLVAAGLTTARLLVPSLADYRHDIEQAASEQLARTVTIGRMQATLRGVYPILKLRDITIAQPGSAEQMLAVEEVWLRLDVDHLLRHRQVRFVGIDVIGVDLVLVRDAGGTLYVEKLRDIGSDEGGGLDALVRMSRLSLHESSITFRDEQGGHPAQRFSSVMLSLNNRGNEHRLTGHAWLPGDVGYRVELDAVFTGDQPDVLTWQGRAYVTGKQLSLPSLLQYWPSAPVVRGQANLRLWVDVAAGRIDTVSSELDISELYVERAVDERQQVFSADALGLRLGWQQTAGNWKAVVHLLSAEQAEKSWVPFDVTLSGGTRGVATFMRLHSRQLLIDDLWQLLPVLPLPDEQVGELAALNLSGELADLDVMLLRDKQGMRLGNIEARFVELGMAETGRTPYLSGLDGVVSGSAEHGRLAIDSRDVDVSDSRLFRDILAISELQGELHWTRDTHGMQLRTERLALVNPDMALLAEFGLALPASGEGASMDLDIDIETADIGRANHYLPAKLMSPTAVAWLDNSLVSGQVRNGSVRIHGRLDRIPFDNGEGQLEVRLPVFNAMLDFNDAWTPITGLDAQVDFTGRSMDITSSRGMIRSAELAQVRARIPDLARPDLSIDGGVRGQLSVMLAELGSSPLGKRFGGFVDRAITTGRCDLELDIGIPLYAANREVSAAGRITLRDNSLKLKDSEITLGAIHGLLTFDGDGISGDDLRTVMNGRPATVRVWGEPGKPDTHIRLVGRLDLLNVMLGKDSALQHAVSGDSDWQVQLTVRGAPARGEQGNVGLQITSTLAGSAVDLPAPFGKPAGSQRTLSVTVDNAASALQRASFRYGDQLKGILLLDTRGNATRLQRGTLTLGGGKAVLGDATGLLLDGRIDTLSLSEWQRWLNAPQPGPAIPLRLDLDVGELEVQNFLFNGLHLAAAAEGRAWRIKVSGESSRGDVDVIRADRGVEKIVMNMERLALKRSSADKSPAAGQFTPADLPELQVTAGEFVYNDANFGQFDLKAVAQANNRYLVERLAVSSGLLSMRLDASWHMTGRDHLSQVSLEILDGDMGRLLDVFGFEKVIKDGKLSATLQASWPAPLPDFSPGTIDGKLNVVIKDGQLLDIEPGASGRALGLLSIGKLPRRLTLDFSDFFGEGFNFERIAGNFVIDQGNAYTNDLEVDGPAARIDISGRVGLVEKDYDQLITVIPYLESSLPLAGALAGGPAVGAVVIVAEKLLDGKLGLNKMASKQYTLIGPWDAPVVTRIESKSTVATDDAFEFDE